MNKVLEKLYIGGVHSFYNQHNFDNFDVVIKLYNNSKGTYPPIPAWLIVHDFAAVDGGVWSIEFFDEVIHTIKMEIDAGHRVYVSCAAGKSRSATIVLAYLVKFGGMNLHQSWKHLKQCRPEVDPSFYLLLSLVQYLDVHPYLHTMVD